MGSWRRWSAFLSAFVLALGVCGATRSAAEAEPIEARAYREMARGDQSRDAGQLRDALARYRAAVQLFETLQRDYPDHKPATVGFRLDYTRRQAAQAADAVAARGDDAAEPAEAPPPRTTPEVAPAEAVRVPADLEEARAEVEHWREWAVRLSGRVREMETQLADSEVRRQAARIAELEAELTSVRRRIAALDPDAVPPAPEPTTPPDAGERGVGAELAEAERALEEGRAARARQVFQLLLDADAGVRRGLLPWRTSGGNPRTRYGLARAHVEPGGDLGLAARLAAGLRREYPEDARYPYLEGRVAQRRQRPAAAARHFARAVELEPYRRAYRLDLATTLHGLGRYDEAAGHYRALIAMDPENRLAHFNLAVTLTMQGTEHHDDARTHYERALELGESADAWIERRLY